MAACVRLHLVTALTQLVMSYPEYRDLIPNGYAIPFPCHPGDFWRGVGHVLVQGSGCRDPFGVGFESARNNWTELCPMDSDGDGRTNGQELGDPDCVWQPNHQPAFTDGLSHPGICDPWNSTTCQQKKLSCDPYSTQKEWLDHVCFQPDKLDCPALSETGVQNLSLRLLPGSSVPDRETTYTCRILDLAELGIPLDRDYHLVAVTPILDNPQLIHHMTLVGCTDDTAARSAHFTCEFLVSPRCQESIHAWSFGMDGQCYHPLTGIRLGLNGVKKIALQVHWNNPGRVSGVTDSSGLMIHYTPNLRPYDAGVLVVGSDLFSLPPGQPEWLIASTCSSGCTQRGLVGPVNITSALNHMHYTGTRMNIEVTTTGQQVTNLTDNRSYSFFRPVVNYFDTNFVLLPGDQVRTNCIYSTIIRNRTTLSGWGAREEMCFGVITYFPRQNLTMHTCYDRPRVSPCGASDLGHCQNLDSLTLRVNSTLVFQDVMENCRSFVPCQPACVQTVVQHMRAEPCMQGRAWEYVQSSLLDDPEGREFLARLASCKVEVYLALSSTLTTKQD